MSTIVKGDGTFMKVTDFKVEVKDSDNVAEFPKEAMKSDIKQEPRDENEAIDANIRNNPKFDLLQGRFEENIETSEKAQESCYLDRVVI